MFKRAIGVLGLTALTGAALFNGLVQAAVDPFPDVSVNHENHTAIEYLHEVGVLKGDDNTGTFRPASNLNRAEFATVLARVAGVTPSIDDYSDCFPDVKDEWYASFVCWAKDQGLVKGYAAGDKKGTYGPGDPLLNAELIVIVSRLADWPIEPHGEWYEPAMNYAKDKNILDEAFNEQMTRGLMAETIFRAAVVDESGDDSAYTENDGDDFVEAEGSVKFGEETTTQPEPTTVSVMVTGGEMADGEAKDSATDVELIKFNIKNEDTENDAKFTGLKVMASEKTNPDSIRMLYLIDADTEDVLATVGKQDVLMGEEREFEFKDFTGSLSPESTSNFVVKGDFDVEESGRVQIAVNGPNDVMVTDGEIKGEFPIAGAAYDVEVENLIGMNADEFPVCASWDAELNLPYASNKDGAKAEQPGEDIGSVDRPEGGHVIEPIDQGNKGICMAAATYSSLRWFEKDLGLDEDLVEDGQNGLDDLVDDLYGKEITTPDEQLAELERKLESEHPECVEVEYDTQAGLNVACDELKEYKDKGCDIPLVFYCTKIDPDTGEDIEGADAEHWGHAVDLVDVQVDENDDDMCSITYANSWKDSANPRPDVDGLGSGRYEEAEYNDDSENFDIGAPWGDNYRCELYAAAYICIDETQCTE